MKPRTKKTRKKTTPQGTTLNLTSPDTAKPTKADSGENLLKSHLPGTKSRRPRFLHYAASAAVRRGGKSKPKE